MRLRCSHPAYLEAVDRFFDALLPRLAPLQVTHGGPILAMQVENEYGSYGNDQAYLRHLDEGMRARGVDVLLFTSDGPRDQTLRSGTLPGILKTVNFASGVEAALAKLREHQPEGPLMVTEFWDGWFDHWGEQHHTRTPEDTAAALDEILRAGASVSLYMFHGGTNFGFMNGANSEDGMLPAHCHQLRLRRAAERGRRPNAQVLASARPDRPLCSPCPTSPCRRPLPGWRWPRLTCPSRWRCSMRWTTCLLPSGLPPPSPWRCWARALA